jgi:hypothetical protein
VHVAQAIATFLLIHTSHQENNGFLVPDSSRAVAASQEYLDTLSLSSGFINLRVLAL